MNWSDIKQAVGKVAPIAGTLLGGPAGAAVGGLISSALGVDNDPQSVATALGNPDALLKLKELESNERQHLLQMQLATLQAELADVQNARASHSNSIMPSVVTAALTLICGGLLYSLLFVAIPADNRELLIQSFGTVLGFWGAALAYWVGTTRSSADKTRIIAG
jgi:hypothetical protein